MTTMEIERGQTHLEVWQAICKKFWVEISTIPVVQWKKRKTAWRAPYCGGFADIYENGSFSLVADPMFKPYINHIDAIEVPKDIRAQIKKLYNFLAAETHLA